MLILKISKKIDIIFQNILVSKNFIFIFFENISIKKLDIIFQNILVSKNFIFIFFKNISIKKFQKN